MKRISIVLIAVLSFLSIQLFAQLEIDQVDTDFLIDFDNTVNLVNNGIFAGDGFADNPSEGQLDANAWAVFGIEDDKDFGEEAVSGAFARGQSEGNVEAGGIYAFEVESNNYALGIQPSGSALTPGYIALKIKNTTGNTIYSATISYTVWVLNNADRSSIINGEISNDAENWHQIDDLLFATVQTASSDPQWEAFPLTETVLITVEPDEYFYFRWFTDDLLGSGSRDEMAIDDILFNVSDIEPNTIDWCNLQEPESVNVYNNESFTVYSRVFAEGLTENEDAYPGIEAWIGISSENTHPENWNTWIPSFFNENFGDNDEYLANINELSAGTYYYAARFRIDNGDYVYGGYSDTGGGFWDGVDNVSGIATVTDVMGSTCDNPFVYELPLQAPLNLEDQTSCGMVNIYGETCLDNYDSGQDVIYNITLTEPAIINIDFDPNGTIRTGIALYDDCPDTGNCLAYQFDNTSNVRNINMPLQPGSYYIIIDQMVVTQDCIDNFSLNISLDDDACIEPTNLQVEVVDNNAIVSWIPGLSETEWQIIYGYAGFDPDLEGTLIDNVTENPYTIESLDMNSNYQIYMRSACENDEYSDWTEPVSFNTCMVISEFPWTETFEDDSEYRSCWRQSIVEGDQYWTFENGAVGGAINSAHNGELNARFYKHSAELLITKLITPIMNTEALNNPVLTFWYAQEEWDQDQNELKVYYRTEQGQGWTLLSHFDQEVAEWTKVLIDLPENSTTFQIAFEGIHKFGRANVIDDVSVRDADDLPQIHEIDYYDVVQDIAVEVGTSEEDAISLLANQITITDTEGDEYTVYPDWTIENYNGSVIFEYDAIGTFTLPDGVIQTDPETDLTVSAIVSVEIGVNISDIESKNISIYPNPNQGIFNIKLSNFDGNYNYSIYDIKGSVQYSGTIANGENNTVISTNLSEGIYFIKIYNDNDLIIEKIVIQ